MSLAGRFWRSRGKHNLFWAIALGMFSLASVALAYGLGIGWNGFAFGVYYLFGAVLNVPFLGLGQIYLVWPDRIAYAASVAVTAFALAATVTVLTTPMTITPSGKAHIPSGREVYATHIPEERLPSICKERATANTPECRRDADPLAIWPRIFAVFGNVIGTLLVVAGTVTSAAKLLRKRNRTRAATRTALGNLAIAAGVIVVASGGTGARFGTTALLPFTLALGVSMMYTGFVIAAPKVAGAKAGVPSSSDMSQTLAAPPEQA